MTTHRIPRRAKAGIAFAGVELKEATPLLGSVFGGLAAGQIWGWAGYLGVPLAGYIVNRLYLDWKSGRLPGELRVLMYKIGFMSFSKAFDRQQKLFIGNSVVINPMSTETLSAMASKSGVEESK